WDKGVTDAVAGVVAQVVEEAKSHDVSQRPVILRGKSADEVSPLRDEQQLFIDEILQTKVAVAVARVLRGVRLNWGEYPPRVRELLMARLEAIQREAKAEGSDARVYLCHVELQAGREYDLAVNGNGANGNGHVAGS